MKTTYVNLKSELTAHKEQYELRGFEVFRTRTACNCKAPGNRRNAIVVARGNEVVAKVIKCKQCRKEASHE